MVRRPATGEEYGASDQRGTQAARQHAADERQFRADQREALADKRERRADDREAFADERERKADRRDAVADQRERVADQREQVADRREVSADQRERKADEREEQLQELIEELRGLVTGAHRDALEAIERSQTLLLAATGRAERGEEAMHRAAARGRRGRAAMARAAAQSERELAHPSPAALEHAKRSQAIRSRLAATATALAAIEDKAADLMISWPSATRSAAAHTSARRSKPAMWHTEPAKSLTGSVTNTLPPRHSCMRIIVPGQRIGALRDE
jgi:hypothetical protein